MRRALVLALLAACPGTPAPPASPPSSAGDCGAAVAAGLSVRGKKVEHAMVQRTQRLQAALTKGCLVTHWSHEATTCYRASLTVDDIQLCQRMLSEEQRDDLTERVKRVMREPPDEGAEDE